MAKKTQNLNIYPGGKLNNLLNFFSDKLVDYKSPKKLYLIVLVIGILLLAIYKKGWFVAAMVNGSPVTNLELQMKLNQQFKSQTLNQLINEKIIINEARKGKAIPSEAEIDQKIAELEKNIGGKDAFDAYLNRSGYTRVTIRDQIRIVLAANKLYEKEATVSASEVTKFIEQNKDQMKASDSASLEKEAEDIIKQQKLSQIINQKFTELRQKAKIQIF